MREIALSQEKKDSVHIQSQKWGGGHLSLSSALGAVPFPSSFGRHTLGVRGEVGWRLTSAPIATNLPMHMRQAQRAMAVMDINC